MTATFGLTKPKGLVDQRVARSWMEINFDGALSSTSSDERVECVMSNVICTILFILLLYELWVTR